MKNISYQSIALPPQIPRDSRNILNRDKGGGGLNKSVRPRPPKAPSQYKELLEASDTQYQEDKRLTKQKRLSSFKKQFED